MSMESVSVKLLVYFEEPFWVGVVERVSENRLSVAKFTFGAEPKDYEVYELLLQNWKRLRFSPTVAAAQWELPKNPKRIQREASKQLGSTGIGTRSQQALQMQREQQKTERKERSREQRDAEKQLQFELRQQKKKEKHKGR